MNAGILRTAIKLYRVERTKTASGFEEERLVLAYEPRAYIRKQMQSYDKDGVQASEQFYGATLVFKVRACSVLWRCVECEYRNQRYSIVQMQEQYDRTALLICKRKDV